MPGKIVMRCRQRQARRTSPAAVPPAWRQAAPHLRMPGGGAAGARRARPVDTPASACRRARCRLRHPGTGPQPNALQTTLAAADASASVATFDTLDDDHAR